MLEDNPGMLWGAVCGVRARAWLLGILLALGALPSTTGAEDGSLPDGWQVVRGTPPVILRAGDEEANTLVEEPHRAALSAANQPGAVITVTYIGFPTQARAAFQRAVDIWQSQIISAVEIKIEARWKALPSGILGMAGPADMVIDVPKGRIYPIALANKLAGRDLDAKHADIEAELNSTPLTKWYFGTDGRTPSDKYDLVTVVLHEIAHGLGATSSLDWVNRSGMYGGGSPFPLVFDTFVADGLGRSLTSTYGNKSLALGTAITSNDVWWSGPAGRAGAGGPMPRLYAPETWEDRSSIGHLDEAAYPRGSPDSLLTPILDLAEAILDPGPILRGMMLDVGWGIAVPSVTFGGQLRGAGAAAGDQILALVQVDGESRACGQGVARLEAGAVTYAMEVSGSAAEGCGRPGAVVTFYVPSRHQLANPRVAWPLSGTSAKQDLELQAPLAQRRAAPGLGASR